MSTSLSGEGVTPLTSSPLHPRVGDGVLVWGDRATLVAFADELAVIATDDETLFIEADRLRWVGDRRLWVIIPAAAA